MDDTTKANLTADIKASWILMFESWYIRFMRRRGNKTGFFITIFLLLVLLASSTIFAYPFLAFGLFMCYTSIASGFKESELATKYNVLLPEVQGLIEQLNQ